MRYEIEVPAGSRGVLRLSPDYRDVSVDGAAYTGGELAGGKHVVRFSYTAPLRETKVNIKINARTP